MAKIIVEMEFDFDGFDSLSDIDKHGSIRTVLEYGAESTNSFVDVKSIQFVSSDSK